MEKLKKIITIISASAMIIVISVQGIYASEEIKDISKQTESKIEDLISVEDGYFDINVEDEQKIIDMVGRDYFEVIQTALDGYNKSVETGDVEITDNGTIIDNGDNALNVQGGNTTKQVSYWWGVKNYMSNSRAKTYISQMKSIKNKTATVASVATTLGSYAGACGGALLSTACVLVALIGGAMQWYLGDIYSKANKVYKKISKKTGLVVEFKIWLAVSCYSQ